MKDYKMNKVEGFNPTDYLVPAYNEQGEPYYKNGTDEPLMYIPTDVKIYWFRMVYPNGAIRTEVLKSESDEVISYFRVKASIYFDVNEPPAAEWIHQESVWDIANYTAKISKAQTMAIGKALSKAGFGCEIGATRF